ncbi:MAG: hypothetical protein ACK55Z_11800, partial [bacterium]
DTIIFGFRGQGENDGIPRAIHLVILDLFWDHNQDLNVLPWTSDLALTTFHRSTGEHLFCKVLTVREHIQTYTYVEQIPKHTWRAAAARREHITEHIQKRHIHRQVK